MKRFTFINLEFNSYNGFVFEFCGYETDKYESELFSIYASKDYFNISILFIRFELL